MKILFDSNCLIADFYMESTPFRVLRTQLPNSGVQLLVSEVVLVEVQNKYRERTQEIVRRIDKDLALLRRLTKRTHVDSRYGDIVESAGRRYDQFLMKELQSLGASFLSIPPVSHQDLIVRTISRRKPFKQNGDGYRDALIWYSVLQALRESHDEIVFITANRADFYQGESLHPDLCADLEVAKVPRERLRICESVTQFNESVLTLLHSHTSPVRVRTMQMTQ